MGLQSPSSGRFQTQAEVKRFLDSKPEYPKDYRNGKEVRFDGVTRLLTSIIYAGFPEKPEWGVPLTRVEHEPLISLETFTHIQARLAEKSVAPARKDIDADFPLRGFLACVNCGGGMTSCWSQSHTGRKYPYYLCKHRGCSERDKSVGRDVVENQFDAILKSLVPNAATLDLAEELFREAWDKRAGIAESEASRLKTRSRQIEGEIETFLDRIVRTQSDVTVGAYEKKISALQSEKAVIDHQTQVVASPKLSFTETFELSMRFLANPYEIWTKGGILIKRSVLRMVFAHALGFSRQTGLRTPETTFPFKALRFLATSDCKMVPPAGLEPATP